MIDNETPDDNVTYLPSKAHPGMTEAEVHPRITRKQFEAERKVLERRFCLKLLMSALDPNDDLYDEIMDTASCPGISHARTIEHLFYAIFVLNDELRAWADKEYQRSMMARPE